MGKMLPPFSSLRRLAGVGVVVPVLGIVACSPPAPTQAVPTAQQAATSIAAVRTQASGTVQGGGTPAVATAQVIGTPVMATAQAAATPVAATAQAAAAQVATSLPPTVAALATQAAGTLQPAVATTVAASRVQISQASVNQGDPTVTIQNSGSSPVDVGGWTLALGPFLVILPTSGDMSIQPGQLVVVHLSQGTSSPPDVFVGAPPAPAVAALQRGAPLVLVDPRGQPTSIYRQQ
ncbi:MAG: lamin tail domain-containing protein [Chloroflexi bacterium]|nr:lamin tail domain-containing protein [Chloroflexota bacterium]